LLQCIGAWTTFSCRFGFPVISALLSFRLSGHFGFPVISALLSFRLSGHFGSPVVPAFRSLKLSYLSGCLPAVSVTADERN
jgi:hypothetical protein